MGFILLFVIFIDFNYHEVYAWYIHQFDGLLQERRNSIANALELRLSCTNPSN